MRRPWIMCAFRQQGIVCSPSSPAPVSEALRSSTSPAARPRWRCNRTLPGGISMPATGRRTIAWYVRCSYSRTAEMARLTRGGASCGWWPWTTTAAIRGPCSAAARGTHRRWQACRRRRSVIPTKTWSTKLFTTCHGTQTMYWSAHLARRMPTPPSTAFIRAMGRQRKWRASSSASPFGMQTGKVGRAWAPAGMSTAARCLR